MTVLSKQGYLKFNAFLEKLIKLLAQTSGKDKFAKILQYGAKLLGYIFLRNSPKGQWVGIMKKLETTSGSARKVWRLGNTFAEQQKIISLFKVAKPFGFLNILALIRQSGMYFYWVFDHLILGTNIGICKFDTVKLGWYSSVSWFFGLLCSIVIDLNTLSTLLKKEKSLKLSITNNQASDTDNKTIQDQFNEVQIKKNEIYLTCCKNASDLLIAATLLKFYSFSQGTVGSAGIVSALIGAYQMWPK
ncbi:hypothetical protein DICPUDRAFT_49683 [Dictyostelium purpureum]|uniref:Peroxisomal biogenesis factor 11 n=1 Tax=Dictyostelium purpureum TaxID=5786 RepID=F0ZUV8_DICPU|nr:uncharacterized protein DICPUDRAFT_49683 [Dictyostelium purpureum]EGC32263.1 hypothetical protein DICPUDRAFT_49683 [Dictyostelium purpureum]|eukprot:XP_003291200.1 hypothetical protein DICPUDRAFT_49683 [Dictyostelium purpureum]